MSDKSIVIAVVSHKAAYFPYIPYHIPICAGAYKNHIDGDRKTFLDNTGDNISHKNGYYNELTAHYWLWKNLPDIDYIGLCHYRRYFNFGKNVGKAPRLGEASIKKQNLCYKYGWNCQDIEKTVASADVIAPRKTARCEPGITIGDHFTWARKPGTLHMVGDCIAELYPEYRPYFDKLLQMREIHSFNMCIMKSELFSQYSEWLFHVLQLVESRYHDYFKGEIGRTCGEMGEYLLNVWLMYQQTENAITVLELQTIMFYETELRPTLKQQLKATANSIFTKIMPYGSKRREIIQYKYLYR